MESKEEEIVQTQLISSATQSSPVPVNLQRPKLKRTHAMMNQEPTAVEVYLFLGSNKENIVRMCSK
jgi:hypothetical protein